MMLYFVSSLRGDSRAAGRSSAGKHTLPAVAPLPRAASLRKLGCFVLATALAGLLPLTGHAQRRTRSSVSALTCSQSTMTGAGSDACTVTLSTAAGSQGTTVSLSSNQTALTVPASVVVPSGATSAAFTAKASAVSSSETATLTATAGGASKQFALTLSAAGSPALKTGATQVSFGSVAENTTATQPVMLTSSGTSALTIQSVTVAGKGFSETGVKAPVTLNPGQYAIVYVQFDPTAAGAVAGTVTISSNAANGSAMTVSLSGTGTSSSTAASVQLSWAAPAQSGDPVAGYKVYRATGSSGTYQPLNTSANQPTNYKDTTVQSGTTYNYKVTSVDASGMESPASNVYTASVP
jgi:hypothetical protein